MKKRDLRDRVADLEQQLVASRALVERLRATPTPEDMWMEVRASEEGREARRFRRMYGRASATIGEQRGMIARLRSDLTAVRKLVADQAAASGPGSPTAAARLVRELSTIGLFEARGIRLDHNGVTVGSRLSLDRDAATVAAAERHGDEIGQRDRTAAIGGVATTLRAHTRLLFFGSARCTCGWAAPIMAEQKPGHDHARHVAEQLAAVGALDGSEPLAPLLADRHGDTWHALADGRLTMHRDELVLWPRAEVDARYGPLQPVTRVDEEVPF